MGHKYDDKIESHRDRAPLHSLDGACRIIEMFKKKVVFLRLSKFCGRKVSTHQR